MKFGFRHVRYFIAVAEEEHFRRAAERLHIAQPALSRAIQHLEEELKVKLFHRSKRSVRISEAGRVFLESCRDLVAGMEVAVENARLADKGQIGSLRIGYTDFAIAGILPDLLKKFQGSHPGISLKPQHGFTTEQLVALEKAELDFGFVTGPVNSEQYTSCPVQKERFICVVYEGHPLATHKSIRLEQLANETFVHGPAKDWEYFYYHLIPLCRRAGFMPKIEQEAYNSAAILGLVASQMGITILTESTRRSTMHGLVYIPFEDLPETLDTIAIWQSKRMSKAATQFVEFLNDQGAGE